MRTSSSWWAAAAAAVLVACGPQVDSVVGIPELVLEQGGQVVRSTDRGVFDFGTINMGRTATLKLKVQNTGSGALTLESVERASGQPVVVGLAEDTSAPFAVRVEGKPSILAAETKEFDLVFQPPVLPEPQADFLSEVRVVFSGTAGGQASLALELKGVAVSGACEVPEVLDFGPVVRDDTFTQEVAFENMQPIATRAQVGTISGEEAFALTADSPRGVFSIPRMDVRQVRFSFKPTEGKVYRATVRVRRAEGCPERTITLLGEGVDSVLTWDPSTVDFGFTPPLTTARGEVTFSNAGFKPLSVFGIRVLEGNGPSTFFKLEQADPGDLTKLTIPGGRRVDGQLVPGTAKAQLSFSPTALGRRSGQMRAESDSLSQPNLIIGLVGIGGGPNLATSPEALVNVGRIAYFPTAMPPSSAVRRVLISNTGTRIDPPDARANLKLGARGAGAPYFRVVGKNGTAAEELCLGDYDATNGTCLGTLAGYDASLGIETGSGKALSVPFRVIPRSFGDKEWDVTILSNDSDEPEKVLTVKAQAVELPPCQAQVTPTTINYGIITPPQERTLGFVIRNMGTQAGDVCLVTNITMGPDSSDIYALVGGDVDEVTIGPGEQTEVRIRAWPTQQVMGTTPASGSVTFNISNPANPQRAVNLLTTIGQGCLTITPPALDFGTVKKDCNSSERRFQVYNSCTNPVTINSVTMAQPAGLPAMSPGCPGATRCAEFFATDVSQLSGTLAPGGTPRTFALRYRPIDFGADTGAFVVRATTSGNQADYVVSLRGAGDTEGRNVDTFRQTSQQKADILFVIDDSCSMSDEQQNLADNFGSFIKFAVSKRVDFRFAVVTTDMDDAAASGKFVASMNGRKVLTPQTPNLELEFKDLVNRGINGSGRELCYEPAVAALTAPLITDPANNAGFLRPDATLAIVCISDELEQSPQPVAFYINQLINVKGASRRGSFELHAIAGFGNPSGNSMCGAFLEDGRYAEGVRLTGGIKEDICTTDWAKTLENIGQRASGFRSAFFLTAPPDESETPIEVTVDGVRLERTDSRGARVWEFDPTSNAVNFEAIYVPEAGRDLRISYRVQCL